MGIHLSGKVDPSFLPNNLERKITIICIVFLNLEVFGSTLVGLLLNDATTVLSKEIYKNIIKSGLHRATIKTPILPCLDVIEWITRKINHQHRSILNAEGKVVANYKPSMINQIYHLKEAIVKISPNCLKQKSESADMLTILKGWWSEGNFRSKPTNVEWKLPNSRRQCKLL